MPTTTSDDESIASDVDIISNNRFYLNLYTKIMTTTLFRPVGPKELALIEQSGWRKFPPRLPEQPIFYPVLNMEYAIQIARDWNVAASGSGFVTRFSIKTEFIKQYDIQHVGGQIHKEYWIPAEDLEEFNTNIVGKIEIIKSFYSSDK